MAKTPLMAQYKEVKEKYRDCLLFYRLGDFYELFYDDALTASHELELTLTGKSAGQDGRVPMCGVPFHAAELYIYRLIQKGYKVAICEQGVFGANDTVVSVVTGNGLKDVANAIKFCGEPMSLPNDLDLLVEEFDKRGIKTEA